MRSPKLVIAALLAVVVFCGLTVWMILPGPAEAPSVAIADDEWETPAREIDDGGASLPGSNELPHLNSSSDRPAPKADPSDPQPETDPAADESPVAGNPALAALQELEVNGFRYRFLRSAIDDELHTKRVSTLLRGLSDPDPDLFQWRLGSDPVAITLSGRVTDEAGRAVENVRIHVWPSALSKGSDGEAKRDILGISKPAKDVMPPHDVERPGTSNYHLSAAGTVVAVTDASGYFHAEVEAARRVDTHAIEALHVSIKPTKPGYAWRSNAEFNNVKPGARIEDIQLVVSRAAIIAGRVVDVEGKPVTNALVAVSRRNDAEPDDGPLPGRAIYHDMRVNADGTFRFDAIQPGTWRVHAFCNSHQSIDGTRSVTLTSGSDVQLPDFVMREASSLRVRVLGADGEPLAKTRITFHVRQTTGSETTRQLTTNDDGEVTYSQIPVATMEVSISAPGYLHSAPYPLHPQGGEALDLGNVALIPAPPGSED